MEEVDLVCQLMHLRPSVALSGCPTRRTQTFTLVPEFKLLHPHMHEDQREQDRVLAIKKQGDKPRFSPLCLHTWELSSFSALSFSAEHENIQNTLVRNGVWESTAIKDTKKPDDI